MKIIITKNYTSMSNMTGRLIADYIKENPNANMCLPTGGSVEGTYEYMCDYVNKEGISLLGITAFNMDEYATLGKENENGYYYFLNKYVYSNTDIDIKNTYAPEADNPDLNKACSDYTELVNQQGGFDFTLLGIGGDGHIAFNMPREALYLDTHIEDLSEETIQANSRFFDNEKDVPQQAVSIGVGMIMKTKKIVLVANGKKKAKVLGEMFNNRRLDPLNPATVLWMHPDVTLILDEEAASEIDTSKIAQWM